MYVMGSSHDPAYTRCCMHEEARKKFRNSAMLSTNLLLKEFCNTERRKWQKWKSGILWRASNNETLYHVYYMEIQGGGEPTIVANGDGCGYILLLLCQSTHVLIPLYKPVVIPLIYLPLWPSPCPFQLDSELRQSLSHTAVELADCFYIHLLSIELLIQIFGLQKCDHIESFSTHHFIMFEFCSTLVQGFYLRELILWIHCFCTLVLQRKRT